jgi:hypothetical protein
MMENNNNSNMIIVDEEVATKTEIASSINGE